VRVCHLRPNAWRQPVSEASRVDLLVGPPEHSGSVSRPACTPCAARADNLPAPRGAKPDRSFRRRIRRTDASACILGSRPDRIADATALITFSGRAEQTSAKSAPALRARTAAAEEPMPRTRVVAPIDRESVTMTVSGPTRDRKYSIALGERLAGVRASVSPDDCR